MPIQASSSEKGILLAQNSAPTPLTKEEWLEVVKVETARIKKIGGWALTLNGDPGTYVVTVAAYLKPLKGGTFVLLDYDLDSPKYRAMGLNPTQSPPPLAVKIAANKFWSRLSEKLVEMKVPEPRRKRADEHEI